MCVLDVVGGCGGKEWVIYTCERVGGCKGGGGVGDTNVCEHTCTHTHAEKAGGLVKDTYIYTYTHTTHTHNTWPRVSTVTLPSFSVAAVDSHAIIAATKPHHCITSHHHIKCHIIIAATKPHHCITSHHHIICHIIIAATKPHHCVRMCVCVCIYCMHVSKY